MRNEFAKTITELALKKRILYYWWRYWKQVI